MRGVLADVNVQGHLLYLRRWKNGDLPVLTLSNKAMFEHSREYAERVAKDVAELMFGIVQHEYRDQPRIYVPRNY